MLKVPPFLALLFGSICATAIMLAAFMLGGGRSASLLMYFGIPGAYVIDVITPTHFWYWAFPEGGGLAGVLLFAIAAWLQFAIIFGLIIYVTLRLRRKNDLQKDNYS